MSNPYGPKIETAEDWNDALGCCCAMPLPPEVIVEYETIRGRAWSNGYYPDDWVKGDPVPQRFVFTYSGSDPFIQTYVRDVPTQIEIGGVDVQVPVETITDNGGTTFGSPRTDTYHDAVTQAAARAGALPIILAGADFSDPDQYKFSGGKSQLLHQVDFAVGETQLILLTLRTRYRFRVPDSHLGTYYKVTWDVLYEPIGWDNTSIPLEDRPVRYSRKDFLLEWEGPGTGAQSDPSWLAGGWYDLPVPEERGEMRIINIRFEHMRRAGA